MSTVRIGVVGCGAIAQVQHLPNLLELDDEFEVPIVCDVSPGQAEYVAHTVQSSQICDRSSGYASGRYRRGPALPHGSQDRGSDTSL